MKALLTIIFTFTLLPVALFSNTFTIEAESMTLSGRFAGRITSPFSGIALYANTDRGSITNAMATGSGVYNVSITGASNNANTAGVSLYVNGVRVSAFTFRGTASSTLEATLNIENVVQGNNTIELILETDNGSSDTFVDRITFTYVGPIVVRKPPVLPAQGAFYTGVYRNMLLEAGYTQAQIDQKLNALWNQLFYGDPNTEAVYFPVGTDQAYILDTGNDDIRSEGMSYGMMIAVQMNKQEEFNRLWRWTKNHMQHQTGPRRGYFAWQVNRDGTIRDPNSASDGEIYFVMALMFASGRWGDGEGIFNYWREAKEILEISMSKENPIQESVTNLFNSAQRQVVFTPFASAATHTNPSYHLPAFVELWGRWVRKNRTFWKEVAAKSREMFPKFAHPQTGLMPNYANFDGTPTGGSHADFRYDAWRCIMNIAMDYAWFKADETQVELVNRILTFFHSRGVTSYGSEFTLSGTQLNSDHSPGLVACNATGSLASNLPIAWDFIDDFFSISIPTGRWRYYDGLLYFMNYLHLSGNFRIYTPALAELDDEPEPNPIQVPGFYYIDNFELKDIGTNLDMLRQHGASTAAARVAANPTIPNERAAHVTTANWDEFVRFIVTLPSNRTLSDFTALEFDIYYNSAASGSDNNFKDLHVNLNNTRILTEATGSATGANHNRWLNRSIPLSNLTGNTVTLTLGIRSNRANYFVDNIRFRERSTSLNDQPLPTFYMLTTENINILNGQTADIRIYDTGGRLLFQGSKLQNLDFSFLKHGVYIVELQYQGKTYHQKIVR